jgi:hypothetical protein
MKRDDTDLSSDARRDRAKPVSRQLAANDVGNAPAFTLTSDQLAAIVRGAVLEALAEKAAAAAAPAPRLLDRNGIAKAIGCSASQVDRLRQRGMPSERFGDSPRFELEACMTWIRGQKDKP